ncbi:MAG: ABC transporter permease subunit [Candidatus Neomarinimicrobiota bacterium]
MRVFTIFLKELKDITRDRRTVFMMVVLPLLLIPALVAVVTMVQQSAADKAAGKQLKVRFVGREFAPDLYEKFMGTERIIMLDQIPVDSIHNYVSLEYLDFAVLVNKHYQSELDNNGQSRIQIIHKSSETLGVTKTRIKSILADSEQEIITKRLLKLNFNADIIKAYDIDYNDVSSKQEIFGRAAGGFLPYIFIIFGFLGAMYPGLDLGAGEKERGTLETILSTPASRLEIVLGKFLVVLTAAVATAFISMAGLYFTILNFPDIPPEFMAVVNEILSPKTLLMLAGLVLPVCAFFSAVILSISIYARSFKEAQSIVAPLNIVIIFPALIGTLPGMELNQSTALIPVLNVSLAAKDLVAGSIDPLLMTEVYGSLFLFAALALWVCVKWFNREETLFRD